MTSAIILTGPQDVAAIARRAEWLGYPCTVSLRKGAHRTTPQNHLAQMWAGDIAAQLGDQTPEEVRGYLKLTHGVPIRCEDEGYRAAFDGTVGCLPHERQLLAMMKPIDTPVTRDMTKGELTRYLDSIQREFLPMGIRLTDPDEARWGRRA